MALDNNNSISDFLYYSRLKPIKKINNNNKIKKR